MGKIVDMLQQIHRELSMISRVGIWESPHVWLTAEEMADLLSSQEDTLSAKTLKEKAAQGIIRGHKIPGCNRWRFNPREVSEDIRNQGQESFAVVKAKANSKAKEILAKHRKKTHKS